MIRSTWNQNRFGFSMIAALAATLLTLYAFLIEPAWLETTEHNVTDQGSGRFRIVQISDLHLKSLGRIEESLITAVSRLEPEVVVLTGDVVDTVESLQNLDAFLRRLRGAHKVAVLGNWEYWSGIDREALKKIYEQNGVSLLVNNETTLSLDGLQLSITGLDDFTAGNPNEPLIQSSSNFRLLLQHSPGYFEQQVTQRRVNETSYDLCLSGHTHSGQITLFGLPLWTPVGSGKFVDGWYQTVRCPLYISRGIGTSLLPARFGARPELSVFEISRANSPL